MSEQCRNCHRQEFAAWQSGPHSANYTRIFLEKKHNAENMLIDDCLRCHGDTSKAALPAWCPGESNGTVAAWRNPDLPTRPRCRAWRAIRCTGRGSQCRRPERKGGSPGDAGDRTPVAGFLRSANAESHVPVAELPVPTIVEGARPSA